MTRQLAAHLAELRRSWFAPQVGRLSYAAAIDLEPPLAVLSTSPFHAFVQAHPRTGAHRPQADRADAAQLAPRGGERAPGSSARRGCPPSGDPRHLRRAGAAECAC